MRRHILLAAVLLAAILLGVTAPAHDASGETWTYSTYQAKGGEAALGPLLDSERGVEINGITGWHAHTDKGGVPGWVHWSPFAGEVGTAKLAPAIPTLSRVSNERDALYRSGFAYGAVYRSGRLCNSTRGDDLKLAGMLADRGDHSEPPTSPLSPTALIIDFRTRSVASDCPDPRLPNVVRLHLPMSADYSGFVTDSARRSKFATALRAIAATPGTVLVHCTKGRDRTGWFISMLLYSLGASDSQVMAEYLRTPGTEASTLRSALTLARSRYGSIDAYLRKGLGLSAADLTALRERLSR